MTKSNSNQTVNQRFGFYPNNSIASISMGPVASKIIDDGISIKRYVVHASLAFPVKIKEIVLETMGGDVGSSQALSVKN